MRFFVFLMILSLTSLSPLCFAAKKKKSSKRASKKASKGRVVKINFDDELLIKGKLLGPSLFTLYQKRNVEFGKLIKPRKNFLPEMRATRGDIE